MNTIRQLQRDLAGGAVTARALVEQSIDAIEDPAGEGSRAFLRLAADRARIEAEAVDAGRAAGTGVAAFAGIPFAVKDLADVAGEVTTAGSKVLADQPPAVADAPAVARVRSAGFILMGRTNMTEFAYSGLGLNEHYDTPRSPWDRATGRIPGGSSSGTAVAVADAMVPAGLGTDTGGSCRIPAAYCGVVGYKPTARRVPLAGIFPLSASLDSLGPLARSVDCCAIVDDLFADGDGLVDPTSREPGSIRLGALHHLVLEDLDPEVAVGYERALSALAAAGVGVADAPFPELEELPSINSGGGLAAVEAFQLHRSLLAERGDGYDSRVRPRIEAGERMTGADYLDVVQARQRLIATASSRMTGFDCFVLPTVANLPPTFASFGHEDGAEFRSTYGAQNILSLRNTSVGNFIDSCSISIPIGAELADGYPVGLMLMGLSSTDRDLFAIARAVEAIITD